ncbi:sodium/potassium/calcium exchanger Nckx30C-like isoform X2 [Ornithodoros turicata]|uniref:sodium/potassium/calcium exchanger Nckx30C-like isoform X2 n=1 Tax=Ornithodoros turicata TaxID=34597 RepID=UPI00313882A9
MGFPRRPRKRWRHPGLVFLSAAFLLGYFSYVKLPGDGTCQHNAHDTFDTPLRVIRRNLLQATNNSSNDTVKSAQFPNDIFTPHQRRRGAVILHVVGMVYMFVALAIICDEFFIPALDVITLNLGISEDVAGATFMAAGGSAPELFTSVIGVFISFDDVGIGTIVGSAVFNILFVISMCAIFSKSVLQLTWWPLFRDVTFYSIILIVLMIFFRDSVILWWEATILLTCYAAYVTFMKFNEQLERLVKKLLNRNKVTRVGSTDHLMPHMAKRRMSAPIMHSGSKFRHGLLQLLIHSIDPLHEHEGEANAKLDEKAGQLHTIASLRVLLDATKPGGVANGAAVGPPPASSCPRNGTPLDNDATTHSAETRLTSLSNSDPLTRVDSVSNLQSESSITSNLSEKMAGGGVAIMHRAAAGPVQTEAQLVSEAASNPPDSGYNSAVVAQSLNNQHQEPIEEPNEPLSVAWPDTWRERFNYVVLAPIIFPLWLTMPDVRRPEKVKYVAGAFLGSIAWIAIFSYLMVWWATVVGETLGIPTEVMGLTFLAAGTSIPDLITSVLVARKGFGDMAVSSSVGSNIFDVAVGLPLPWLLSCMIFGPVKVSSTGMACSIFILFMMLIFVIVTIAIFHWRMNVGLALVMFFLYFVFIACSLILEYEVLSCQRIIAFLKGVPYVKA